MKRRGSMAAKAAAWVGLTICAFGFAGSMGALLAMWETDMYSMTEEELKQNFYEMAADRYMWQALAGYQSGKSMESLFANTSFRGGIIKAENIYDVDLNDPKIYEDRNFSEPITDSTKVYSDHIRMGPETKVHAAYSMFDSTSVADYHEKTVTEETIEKICYDGGIFYYKTADACYPVKQVRIGISEDGGDCEAEFYYDNQTESYRLRQSGEAEDVSYVTTAPLIAEAGAQEAGIPAELQAIYTDTAGNFNFELLEGTLYGPENWVYLCIGDAEWEETLPLPVETYAQPVDAGDISKDTEYQRLDESRLEVYREANEDYQIVALLPEQVTATGIFSEDLYGQAASIVSWILTLRYAVFVIIPAIIIASICLFVFLIRSAGHRKGTEEIVMTWADEVPTDVFLAIAGMTEVFLLMLGLRGAVDKLPTIGALFLLAGIALCMCYLALFAVLSLAVRIKTGTIWKNTWTYKIGRTGMRLLRLLAEHLPLLWKAILLLALYVIAEMFLLEVGYGYLSRRVMLIFLLKYIGIAAVLFWGIVQMNRLSEGGEQLAAGDLSYQIDTGRMYWEFKRHGEHLNSIGEAMSRAVDERMKSERFKTELITNVSHDIKTPLTSIINYVDLLEKECRDNDVIAEYIDVLERQSARLKKLIEDLIEASKASSGSLPVHTERLEAGVFLVQTVGEFEERTKANRLELLIRKPEDAVYIKADGRHLWRVIDNLMNNVCKYAQPDTRVYIDMETAEDRVEIIFRNTSKYPLNISGEELTERFVRGDSSRNTEGSGLGLSIARSLTELMGGLFSLYVDGDLFKVILSFPIAGL